MKLSSEESRLLPTADDIAFYETHGWYISKKIIPDDVIDEALYGCERFYAGERDRVLPLEDSNYDWKPEHGNVMRHNSYISLQNEQVRKLVMLPLLGAVAAKLNRSNVLRLFRDTLIYKPPFEGSTQSVAGWHTDRAYWLMCSTERMLSAFIPLHDCDEEMGTLTILDGSHRWPQTSDLRTFHEQDLDGRLRGLEVGGNEIIKVPMNLKKGQVSFHHSQIIHGSYYNHTGKPRWCMTVHMQDGGNRFQEYYDPEGVLMHHANDLLCRKLPSTLPDYTDPDICPVLYQEND